MMAFLKALSRCKNECSKQNAWKASLERATEQKTKVLTKQTEGTTSEALEGRDTLLLWFCCCSFATVEHIPGPDCASMH